MINTDPCVKCGQEEGDYSHCANCGTNQKFCNLCVHCNECGTNDGYYMTWEVQ